MKRFRKLLLLPGRRGAEKDYQDGQKPCDRRESARETRYFFIRLQDQKNLVLMHYSCQEKTVFVGILRKRFP